MNWKEIISNVCVYGIEESIIASGYPMSVDIHKLWVDEEVNKEKNINRAKKLSSNPPGSGHATFLQGCIVQFDLTFTVKAWTEAQRYHFFDFVSSQSTMHRLVKMDLDKSYIEYVDPRIVKIMKQKVEEFNSLEDNEKKKEKYLEILYSNPCGCRLTARMTTNYQQLKTILGQRSTHKLPEWRAFCEWIKTLPYSYLITGEE